MINMKFVNQTDGSTMIVVTRAPLSLVSKRWVIKYIDENKVDVDDITDS